MRFVSNPSFHPIKTPRSNVLIRDNGCWEWTGRKNYGYGVYYSDFKTHRVHVEVYKSLVGDIDGKNHLHHICENRACFNPSHLTQLTPNHHSLIASSGTAYKNRIMTTCKNGHEFTPENTRITYKPDGSIRQRRCLICYRAYHKRRWAKPQEVVNDETS